MQPVKRVEIIVDSPELPALLAALRQGGVRGYTIISPVTGLGTRGERRNDEPGGGSGSACILIALPSEEAAAVVEVVRPVIKKRGGVCLVSDAQWVVH
jgi:hypothetical protein